MFTDTVFIQIFSFGSEGFYLRLPHISSASVVLVCAFSQVKKTKLPFTAYFLLIIASWNDSSRTHPSFLFEIPLPGCLTVVLLCPC